MSRLQQLVISIRTAWLHHEIDALKRRHARAQRKLQNRPYVPSAHLVPGYLVADEPLQDPAASTFWFRATALVLAFAAGVLFASMLLPAAPAEALATPHQVCTAEYETP